MSASDYELASIGNWYRTSCEDALREIHALQALLDADDVDVEKVADHAERLESMIMHMMEYGPLHGPTERVPKRGGG
jgi:hypothetical protein